MRSLDGIWNSIAVHDNRHLWAPPRQWAHHNKQANLYCACDMQYKRTSFYSVLACKLHVVDIKCAFQKYILVVVGIYVYCICSNIKLSTLPFSREVYLRAKRRQQQHMMSLWRNCLFLIGKTGLADIVPSLSLGYILQRACRISLHSFSLFQFSLVQRHWTMANRVTSLSNGDMHEWKMRIKMEITGFVNVA